MHYAYQEDIRKIYTRVGSGRFFWAYIKGGVRGSPQRYTKQPTSRHKPMIVKAGQIRSNYFIWRLNPDILPECENLWGPAPPSAKYLAEQAVKDKINEYRDKRNVRARRYQQP